MTTTEVAVHLPYLRRFARALTGSREDGDATVAATLKDLIAGRLALHPDLPVKVALFRAYWLARPTSGTPIWSCEPEERCLQLGRLEPVGRAVYLLCELEQFTEDEIAAVTGLDPRVVAEELSQSRRRLSQMPDASATGRADPVSAQREAKP